MKHNKIIKCQKCGKDELVIRERICTECEYNGFYNPDKNDCLTPYYDESFRLRLEDKFGVDIPRAENYENGTCKIAESITDSCWTYECRDCGVVVQHVPLMTC